MHNQNEIRPVFIIGAYRSGTSILTWALGQHPNILPLEETNWIARLGSYAGYLYELGTVNGDHSHISSMGITKDEFYSHFGNAVDLLVRTHTGRYLEESLKRGSENPELCTEFIQLDRSESKPKTRWIDGTPENSRFVYGLNRLFPEAKFIHILRNPRHVARSLMHFSSAGGTDYKRDEAYAAWLRLVKASVEAEMALGSEKVLRVHYEDLLVNPEPLVRNCLEFVDEPFDENCLSPFNVKINNSKYQESEDHGHAGLFAIHEKEALEFYSAICERKQNKNPDPESYRAMEQKSADYTRGYRILQDKAWRFGKWARSIDKKNLPALKKMLSWFLAPIRRLKNV